MLPREGLIAAKDIVCCGKTLAQERRDHEKKSRGASWMDSGLAMWPDMQGHSISGLDGRLLGTMGKNRSRRRRAGI